MIKLIKILLLILLVGCTRPIAVKNYFLEAEQHQTFGGSSQNTFFYDEEISLNPILEWDASTQGSYNNSSFIAYDSLLIVSDLSGRVTAFHVASGKKMGEIKYSGGIEQAPVIKKSYMTFIVNDQKEKYSTLVVYDIVNSKEINTLELFGKFRNELLLINDFIYAITDFGKIYKITGWGSLEWTKDLDTEIHSNPAGDDEYIYLASVDGKVLKVDATDGSLVKENVLGDSFQSGLTIDGDDLYFGGNSGKMYSVNKNTLIKNWEFSSSSKIVHTPAFDELNIFFGNLIGDFYSCKKVSGNMNWNYKTNGLINASPIVFNNVVLQPNLEKRLDIYDINDGTLLNQIFFDLRCRTTPLFYKNRLFIGVDKGEVQCYSFEEKSLDKGKL